MKTGIHPAYDFVVVKDGASDFAMLTRSTQKSGERITWEDGKEYPLVTVEVSSASHPFFTGQQKIMDATGRIERFKSKYRKDAELR